MSRSPSDYGLGDDNKSLSHSAGSNEHSPIFEIRATSELVITSTEPLMPATSLTGHKCETDICSNLSDGPCP